MKCFSAEHPIAMGRTLILMLATLTGPAFAEDVEAILRAADQGDAQAQFTLGARYELGQGVPQDYQQAARWFRAAAKRGHAEAQFKFGVMCDIGRGVKKDYREAARWVRAAAEQGHAEAQSTLGTMYGSGRGVPQDDQEAVRWLRAAADQGNAYAQFNLGTIYSHGLGVPQNHVKAYMWFSLAASDPTGDNRDIALRHREVLAKQMTPEGIAEAQRLVRDWKSKASDRP